jgi:hypothetical protein
MDAGAKGEGLISIGTGFGGIGSAPGIGFATRPLGSKSHAPARMPAASGSTGRYDDNTAHGRKHTMSILRRANRGKGHQVPSLQRIS